MLVMGGSARDWWDRKGCRVNVHHLKFNHTDNVDNKKHIVMMVTSMIMISEITINIKIPSKMEVASPP